MIDKLFKIILLLSPIAYGVNINLDKFDMRFFQVGTIALFAASLFERPLRGTNILKKPIALLLGLVILNSFWHKYQPMDIRCVEDLFFGIIALVVLCQHLKEPRKCLPFIFCAMGINFLVAIFQRIGYSPMLSTAHYGSYIGCEGGLFGSWPMLSVYMALLLPFLWRYSRFITVIFLISITAFYHKYPQMSLYIPLGIIILLDKRTLIKKYLPIFLIGSGFIFSVIWFYNIKHILMSIAARWESWKPMIDMLCKQPMLGYGLGTYYIWSGREPFNSYLPFIYGVGILGIVWFGYVIKDFIKRFDPSVEWAAVLGFLVISLIEYPIEIPRLWFTIIFIFAAWIIKQMEVTDESSICRS